MVGVALGADFDGENWTGHALHAGQGNAAEGDAQTRPGSSLSLPTPRDLRTACDPRGRAVFHAVKREGSAGANDEAKMNSMPLSLAWRLRQTAALTWLASLSAAVKVNGWVGLSRRYDLKCRARPEGNAGRTLRARLTFFSSAPSVDELGARCRRPRGLHRARTTKRGWGWRAWRRRRRRGGLLRSAGDR